MTERVERWCRGVASLALLLGLVVGVPAALLVLGGDPVPRRWDLASLGRLLLRPDDGTVLARVLAIVGWLAWAVFVVSLLTELVNLVRRRAGEVVLPGLGGVQQWAAGLMLAVVALGAAAQLTSGPASTSAVVAPVAVEPPAAPPQTTAAAAPGGPGGQERAEGVVDGGSAAVPLPAPRARPETVHTVVAGDDLWSLAERYYGRGQDWRRIATANPDRLTGGPDRLRVGWRLVVPDAEQPRAVPDGVRVRAGDTLSAVAERVLGRADRWPDLYRANRDQLNDPDSLPVGLVLRVPGGSEGHEASSGQDRVRTAEHAASERPAPEPSPSAARPTEVPAPPAPTSAPTAPGTPAATASATPSAGPGTPTSDVPGTGTVEETGPGLLVPGLATVGGLLAASLLGGLAARRRWQLQRRPLGRRILHPPPGTRPVEVELARRARRPIGLRTLDRASRAVVASCVAAGVDVPALRSASVSDEWLVLELAGATPPAPRCFVDTGGTWCLSADAADGLLAVPGMSDAVRPWPLLVTLGVDDLGSERVVDLESIGLLAVTGEPGGVTGVLAAAALELACSPWTEDLRLTLVGDDRLAPALAQHNVRATDELDPLLDRLERLADGRRSHAAGSSVRDLRLDPDRAEAWTPEVVLVDLTPTPAQAARLARLTDPGVGITVVVRGPVEQAVSTLLLTDGGRARLLPDDVGLVAQTLRGAGLDPVVALVAATGSEETRPAPWWSATEPPGPPPDNVTYLGSRRTAQERDDDERRAAVQARMTEAADGTVRHPLLQLIGPVELLGAAGTPPARAAKQCLEYCAWLLEHPQATAQAMAAGLLVAEGTRRSNMSRLRTWLGEGPDGDAYLPDAYSGRIALDPVVTSDWHQLRLLLGDGVDRATTAVLELALRLVRGAPLADAAPVQWHWAEELRTDIVSCLRDVGVELARRSLADRDVDLARWAASRALVVAPGDELLLATRIRTEHVAGNAAETERLSLQLAQQARATGVDLDPASVDLIQEVMEGRVRSRLA